MPGQGKWETWGWRIPVVLFLVFIGCTWVSLAFDEPWTSWEGFSSDAVPTINEQGDIDCGGSSIHVVLHGPTVQVPPGDLAREAEKACRDDAGTNVVSGGLGLLALAGAGLVVLDGVRSARGVMDRAAGSRLPQLDLIKPPDRAVARGGAR